jgi:hypothetical protein
MSIVVFLHKAQYMIEGRSSTSVVGLEAGVQSILYVVLE